jgi:HEAT repeat protein
MRASLGVRLFLYGLLTCGSAQVAAEDARVSSSKPGSIAAEQLRATEEKLEKGDAAAIEQALGVLGQIGGDAAAQSVVARLRRGLPPQLTEMAIDVLVLLQRPVAAPALLELTLHRRVPIRVKAIAALGALKARSAQSALLYALDDPSAEVRGAAVQALASAGNARALPALLTAAERGVAGSWQAIGNLATAADLKRLLERAHGGDVTVLRPALDELMARTNLPLEAKLRMVQELEKLGSPSARACLVEWLAAMKTDGPARVRQVLFASIKKLDQAAPPTKAASVADSAAAKPKLGKLVLPNPREPLAEAPSTNREAAR